MKPWLLRGLAVLLGLAASEAFVRVLYEPEMLFEWTMSPGAYRPDEVYGFTFTPNWSGTMRNWDGVWGVPVQLDGYGYRLAVDSPLVAGSGGAQRAPARVLFLGGRSATMGYGLRDEQTVHARLAQLSPRPLHVQTTGWAGFDMYRSWKYFEAGLGRKERFDVVLLCVNPNNPELFLKVLPPDLGSVLRHPLHDQLFSMTSSIVRVPEDGLERALGRDYYRSWVLYGLLRYRKQAKPTWRRVERALGLPQLPARTAPTPEEVAAAAREGLARFTRFVALLRDDFAARGTRFGVVFLPSPKWPLDGYDTLAAALPEDVPRADVHRALHDRLDPRDYIGNGHWNEPQAALVAGAVLPIVERLLASGDDE